MRSAGRVQSVALRLICEREAEIESFTAREYWTVEARVMTGAGETSTARLSHLDGTELDRLALRSPRPGTCAGDGGAGERPHRRARACAGRRAPPGRAQSLSLPAEGAARRRGDLVSARIEPPEWATCPIPKSASSSVGIVSGFVVRRSRFGSSSPTARTSTIIPDLTHPAVSVLTPIARASLPRRVGAAPPPRTCAISAVLVRRRR